MKNTFQPAIFTVLLFLSACSVWQSALKSTFPYTTDITIPRASADNTILSTTASAASFDQRFNKNGNNADKIKDVKIVSAKLIADDPSDFNLGNLSIAKVYLTKGDGKDEVLVASRTDITPMVGNSLVLDIDNSRLLDDFIKDPAMKVRLEYQLRDHICVNAHLTVSLGLRANP